jgi:hypothetical protein
MVSAKILQQSDENCYNIEDHRGITGIREGSNKTSITCKLVIHH